MACDLAAIYPQPGVEHSFEELIMQKRMAKDGAVADSWTGWEWNEAWKEETARTGSEFGSSLNALRAGLTLRLTRRDKLLI